MAHGRILVIRLSALGDVLFTLPAVHALKVARPELKIDWVVEDRAASLLDLYPGLEKRIVWQRAEVSSRSRNPLDWPSGARSLSRHVGELRRSSYDAVLDFQGNLKSGVHTLLARGRRKLGFERAASKEGNWLFRHESVPTPQLHRVDRALALARAFEPAIAVEATRPPLRVPNESREFVAAALRDLGIGDEPFVVLHPGTSKFGAFKRWAPDRFANVADLLVARLSARVLVSFGPGEEELARSVVKSAKEPGVALAPSTRSLPDLAALLQRARAVVASDSAALHLAAFLATPVVGLYGPKDPRIYGPRFAPARVVHTWLPCSPCSRRKCPDVLCMEEISVRQVFEATRDLLSAARSSGTVGPPVP